VKIPPFVWKPPVVAGALLVGAFAANQAGWSGAEAIASRGDAGFVTDLFFTLGAGVCFGTCTLVQRIAKPVLWVMVPICLYSALVLGAWNGFASDFDATRGEAIKHHMANAYALEHMSERGRFLSCQDGRIELTEDAKAVCARALNVAPGDRIPGSEHKCGLLGLMQCFDTAPENKKPIR
jgi:hypothetical protein